MDTAGNTNIREARLRWVILSVIYFCHLSFSITLQSVPPVLPLIMAELNLSYSQAGLLMSLMSLPGIVISIPAGMLADRYGQKTIGVVSFTLIIIGTVIFASGSSIPILCLGRVLAGIGAIILVVLAYQILAQWFAGHEVGIAMGVVTTSMPVGTILSLNLFSVLGEGLGWRATILLSAGLPFAALVIFAFLFAPAPQRRQPILMLSQGIFQDIRLVGASIWFVGAAWMFFNAAFISLLTFSPDLLKAAGFSTASAGFHTSVLMWPPLVLNPLVGYLIHKINHKRALIAVGGLALTALIFWVPTATGWMLGLMLLIGIAQILVPPSIMALSPDVVSPKRLGLGFGIINSCLNLGILFGPTTVGFVRDIVGSYQASYALMSLFALLVTISIAVEPVKHLLRR
ncbi:CynX/NimT family MFS transporter [Chloroflexota bacterium]